MEEKENVVVEETTNTDVDYIETINNLKRTTVPKEEFDRIREENKRLLTSLANGKVEEQAQKVEPEINLDDLRTKVFSQDVTNLDFWVNTLKLREELIKRGDNDIFLPYGTNISPTYDDIQAANRVADVVSQCIEYAQGDSSLFTQELQRRTNDVRIRR